MLEDTWGGCCRTVSKVAWFIHSGSDNLDVPISLLLLLLLLSVVALAVVVLVLCWSSRWDAVVWCPTSKEKNGENGF